MHEEPSGTVVGRVAEVWRFPVKSMLGERLDQIEVTAAGVVGDRGWALVDAADGKVVSAKNPRKWGRVLELRASYAEEPTAGAPVPPVLIELPDATTVRSDAPGADDALSAFLGRPVRLASVAPAVTVMEETWPEVEGLAPDDFIARTRIETPVPEDVVSDINDGDGGGRRGRSSTSRCCTSPRPRRWRSSAGGTRPGRGTCAATAPTSSCAPRSRASWRTGGSGGGCRSVRGRRWTSGCRPCAAFMTTLPRATSRRDPHAPAHRRRRQPPGDRRHRDVA
jgi:hypothetical protein